MRKESIVVNKTFEQEEGAMNMIADTSRPCTIQESIIESMKEVKQMREGKLPKRSWKKFVDRMSKEIAEDKHQ